MANTWHSLFEWVHIPHKHASWKHGQCWRRKFSFLLNKNQFSIFWVWKMVFFAKHQPQICCKNWEIHYLKTLYHVICTNNQTVSSEKVSIHLFWKTQVSVDSAGNDSNLNYRCLIVCSWFLAKIIIRYTTTNFIRDTPRVPQYSTPSYARSCPPSWLFLEFGIENSKIFKKNSNWCKTFAWCHYICPSTQKKKKLGIRQLYWKGVHINELSSMKILGFRSKWRVLWPHPWHSLLKCAHIMHKHASWKHRQCWRRKFSFL